jgi:hypothetical protein
MTTSVLFDEESHKYFIGGQEIPSVTEICDPVSFKKLDAISKIVLERAATRGHLIHEIIADFICTGEIDIDNVPNEFVGYIYAFLNWWRTYKPKVLFSELILGDTNLGYGGTCDIVAEIDDKTLLIDTKSTSLLDKKYLSVQLEGYKRLLKRRGISIDGTFALHIKKDQSWAFPEIKTDPEWFDLLLEHNKKMRGKYGK